MAGCRACWQAFWRGSVILANSWEDSLWGIPQPCWYRHIPW